MQEHPLQKSQGNFLIYPPKRNEKPAQQSPLPAIIPSAHIRKIIENTQTSEEFLNAIRIFVFLENGRRRFLTFLIDEACTVQDLLEEVNIPLQKDTHIQVIETNSDVINYVVSIGNAVDLELMSEQVASTSLQNSFTNPGAQHHLENQFKENQVFKYLYLTDIPGLQEKTLDPKSSLLETIKEIPKFQMVPVSMDRENDMRTELKCRMVWIGSYKCVPNEKIIIDNFQVTMKVPSMNNENGCVKITLEKSNTVKVLICFNNLFPVFFYYLNPMIAMKIRENLHITYDSDYYFDPLSLEDEAHRRIILLPDCITEDNRNILRLIYNCPANILAELDTDEAHFIMNKICPEGSDGISSDTGSRRLLIYPPNGPFRICIKSTDYIRLGQHRFLNDVILEFYLSYLLENLPSQQKSKVHLYSTFFYTRLTSYGVHENYFTDLTLTPVQRRHAGVKKWTKNVNIFDKDFLIIPINENLHWYLAIICFPGMDGRQTWKGGKIFTENENLMEVVEEAHSKPAPNFNEITSKNEAEEVKSEIKSHDYKGDATLLDNKPAICPESTQNFSQQVRQPIKQPCILIFDSVAASRPAVGETLRDYLTCEYKSQMGIEKLFNEDNIKSDSVKVPRQTNNTDCGLFLLQYVEQFLKDPITDYNIPIRDLTTWFDVKIIAKKREDIANLIRSLMVENGKDLNGIPDINFS